MSAQDSTAGLFESLAYGYGSVEVVPITTPAAGANASLKVTKAGAYRLLAVVATLATDATVKNRWIELDYQTDAGLVYCRNGGAPIITASTTVNVCWKVGQGLSDFASAASDYTPIVYPLAPIFIPQGDAIAVVVGNIQATDQLSAMRALVEEITEGPRGYPVGRIAG